VSQLVTEILSATVVILFNAPKRQICKTRARALMERVYYDYDIMKIQFDILWILHVLPKNDEDRRIYIQPPEELSYFRYRILWPLNETIAEIIQFLFSSSSRF